MDRSSAQALVDKANWYHSYEVLDGLWTPGVHRTDARKVLNDRFNLPASLAGKNVLDIGALDGPYSFELERRGARVTAMDIQSPDVTGFNTAKAVRESSIRYVQGSVYGLTELLGGEQFDIITYFGVWYHLKHPILAVEQIAASLKPDGQVLFEGEALKSYAEKGDNSPSKDAKLIAQMADSDIPVTLYYAGPYKGDQWSWFVPNRACVVEWFNTAGMEIKSHGFWDDHPHQRMFGTAVKRPGATIHVDNPVWGKG